MSISQLLLQKVSNMLQYVEAEMRDPGLPREDFHRLIRAHSALIVAERAIAECNAP